jgi:hypothetical protein
MFAELEFYFSLYWREIISHNDVLVGHPSGNLQYVDYRHYYGLPYCAPEANRDLMCDLCNSLEPYDEYISHFNGSFAQENGTFLYSEPYNNWSNANLDTRYYNCPYCDYYSLEPLSSDGLCRKCEDGSYDGIYFS